MDSLERNLLWDGVEDYAGLWDAAVTARDTDDAESDQGPRERARRALVSLLDQGLIVLYTCRGLPTRETVNPVLPEDRYWILGLDGSWEVPDEGDVAVWYETTDEGFAAYRKASGWAW